MDLLRMLCNLRQEEWKNLGKISISRASQFRHQTVLPPELNNTLIGSLKIFLSKNSVLLELMCVAYGLALKKVSIDRLVRFGDIGLLPEVYVLGLNKGKNGSAPVNTVDFDGKSLGAKFLIFNCVWIYVLFVDNDDFVCRIVEDSELYIKPKSSRIFNRKLDITSSADITKETAMGLIEKYSGLFGGESYFYLQDGDFVTTKVYLENKLKESNKKLKEAERRSRALSEERRPVLLSDDDDEDAEVYRIFGGKKEYEKYIDPNWEDKLYRPEEY